MARVKKQRDFLKQASTTQTACRAPSAQTAANDALLDNITDLDDDSDGVWGALKYTCNAPA